MDFMLLTEDIEYFLHANRGHDFLWSIKIDGMRVAAIIENGSVSYVSRGGNPVKGCAKFDGEVLGLAKALRMQSITFDCEFAPSDGKYQSDKQKALFVFDIILDAPFLARYAKLEMAFNGIDSPQVVLVEQHATNADDVYRLRDAVVADGYEGIVVRTADGAYEHKRSNLCCKLKKHNRAILDVIGMELGKGAMADVAGALICQAGDVRVRVGAGMTLRQRTEFVFALPRQITISYMERTKAGSFRHPVLVGIN